ncbi:hypothetical protein LINPERHAP2_LOCUS23835 [Linum perenne]
MFSKSWNEGWLKYATGTTIRFLWFSPTYTARKPFGTFENLEVALFEPDPDRRRICLARLPDMLDRNIAACVIDLLPDSG